MMRTVQNREAVSSYLPLCIKHQSTGKVHSKFNRGVNIQFGDFLVYISYIGTPLSVLGLNIEEQKIRQILDLVDIDDIVVNKDDKLVFYNFDEIISVDYKYAVQEDLKLPKIKCSIERVPDTRLYKHLGGIDFNHCIGIIPDETVNNYVDLLWSSDKCDMNMNHKIVSFFTGRGKGLTPSGDDILAGFTLALMVFNKSNKWAAAMEVGVSGNKTTVISEVFIRALLRGYASEQYIQLAELLDNEDGYVIDETLKKVRLFGHTSGNDTLFGFFLGLKSLINQEEVQYGKHKNS